MRSLCPRSDPATRSMVGRGRSLVGCAPSTSSSTPRSSRRTTTRTIPPKVARCCSRSTSGASASTRAFGSARNSMGFAPRRAAGRGCGRGITRRSAGTSRGAGSTTRCGSGSTPVRWSSGSRRSRGLPIQAISSCGSDFVSSVDESKPSSPSRHAWGWLG